MTVSTSIKDMMKAGVHFGHRSSSWNPKMAPYIYGVYNQTHILDLQKTLTLYQEAMSVVHEIASRGGKILLVGTKRAAREVVAEAAERCGMPYITHRWYGGMLTNYKTIRQSIKRLKELEALEQKEHFAALTKKEVINLKREHFKLDRDLGGVKDMGGLPDALFVIDTGYESIALAEAKTLRIPVIGVVDTNTSPDGVDFIIPGNDDGTRAIKLYVNDLADVIIEAQKDLVTAEPPKSKPKKDSTTIIQTKVERAVIPATSNDSTDVDKGDAAAV